MKSKLFAWLTLSLIASGAASAADCPDKESAKDGFTLEKKGVQSEYRPSGEMIVHVSNVYGSAIAQTQFFFGGLIEVYRDSERGQFTLVPLSDLRSIFPLKAGDEHTISFLRLTPKKKTAAQQTLEMQVTGKETFQLGECEYSVLTIEESLQDADGKELDAWTSFYAPDLQAVLAKQYDKGTAQESTVRYDTIKPLTE